MPGIVVDTHAIVWYLQDDPRFSTMAAAALDAATEAGDVIYIPSICLVELSYLIEKRRLPAIVREQLIQTLDDPTSPCSLVPLDSQRFQALRSFSNEIAKPSVGT